MQRGPKSWVIHANKNRLLLFNSLINYFVSCLSSEKICFLEVGFVLTEAV